MWCADESSGESRGDSSLLERRASGSADIPAEECAALSLHRAETYRATINIW